MHGIGVVELIYGIIGIVVILGIFTAKRSSASNAGGPVLTLSKFQVNENENADILVDISGRGQGAMAWFMTLIKIDVRTYLTISKDAVSFTQASLSGQKIIVAPLNKVSNLLAGYSKPISFLIVSAICLIGGIAASVDLGWMGFAIGLILALIFLAGYALKKNMTIAIMSDGMLMGITFKRSIIENVPVDIERVKKAIELTKKQLLIH